MSRRNDPRHESCVVSSLRAASVSLRRNMKIISSRRRRRPQLAGKASMAGWASEAQCSSGIRSLISGEVLKSYDNNHRNILQHKVLLCANSAELGGPGQ